MDATTRPGRIDAFDYLRGFFIIVIVIDHLYRWPSFLSIFTGEGMLWANAADGFLIISGLLVGYIRGYKTLLHPFTSVAAKLARRAGSLYVWSVGLTILLAAIQWWFSFKFPMPNVTPATGDWPDLALSSLTLAYAHPWIYFLHLYAIFMLLAIGVVWLLRHKLGWLAVILSLAGLAIGNLYSIEWLEKQSLFLIPAIVGFSIDSIRQRVGAMRPPARRTMAALLIGVLVSTVTLSALWRFMPELFNSNTYAAIDEIFRRQPMGLGATLIAFVWFIGLFTLFSVLIAPIKRYLGWLLLPFGQRSLAAYILHCVPLLITSYLFTTSDNVWFNTLLGVLSILSVLLLLHIPFVRHIMPR